MKTDILIEPEVKGSEQLYKEIIYRNSYSLYSIYHAAQVLLFLYEI